MQQIKNINIDSIHLFETSVIGKPCSLNILNKNFVILPIYKLVTYEGALNDIYDNAILIFTNVSYLKYKINYFDKVLPIFSKHKYEFETKYSEVHRRAIKEIAACSVTENGAGDALVALDYEQIIILFDRVTQSTDLFFTNIDEVRNDKLILNRLCFPDLGLVSNEIIKWDINASTPMPPKA